MFNKMKSDYISWTLLIGVIVLLLEVSFFNSGLIFSLLVAIGMVYIGRKRMPRTSGKALFWVGLVFFIISVLNMMAFKFFLIAILVHFVIQFSKSKKNAERIRPIVKEPNLDALPKEMVVKKKPLFENTLFGQQKTPDHVYEWSDINIQTGVGDTIVDLSYTVLPKGETVIFIRNVIGNVQVLIPYDLEVSVHHSVVAGSSEIFNYQESRMFNQNIQLQTPEFERTDQRIKIFTSFFVGDIEVKRV